MSFFVEKLRSFIDSKEKPLSLVGPLLLMLAITLLWGFSKEVSPILPAAGLVGLAFTWLGRSSGLWVAQTIIVLAVVAAIWSDPFDIYWKMGFGLSLSLSLFITSLAQTELVDTATTIDSQLQVKASELTEALNSVAVLQSTLQDKEVYLSIARDEFLHLQKQQREWSNAVFEQKQKTAQVEELLEDQILEATESPEYRRLNGAYTQLKEQFKEKDKVLTETRKELFLTQEQAGALSKELDEFKLYGVPSEIAQLQRHVAETEQQSLEEIERLRAEIQALEAIIESGKRS